MSKPKQADRIASLEEKMSVVLDYIAKQIDDSEPSAEEPKAPVKERTLEQARRMLPKARELAAKAGESGIILNVNGRGHTKVWVVGRSRYEMADKRDNQVQVALVNADGRVQTKVGFETLVESDVA